MGAVSDHLRSLVEKQVSENRLVVWFDPEQHYRDFVDVLSLPNTAIEVCGQSFFELRRHVKPHLSADGDRPPRLVVYVPKSEEDTHDALVELTEPGVVMKPRQQPRNRNTRLSVVAKTALRPVLGDEQAAKIEKDVEAGRLVLTDLDNLGAKQSSVVSLIFGTAYPQEVALKFLGSMQYDPAVVDRKAIPDLASLLGGAFAVPLSGSVSCDELRASLARHVLSTELVRSMSGPLPSQLSSVKAAREDGAAETCASLAHEWRNRRDLRESYAEHADRVEGELGIGRMDFDLDQIRGCETFAGIERALQTSAEEKALSKLTPEEYRELRKLIERRLQGFWSSWPERYGEIQPRWRLIQAAVEVIHAAGEIEEGLKGLSVGPEEILRRYAGDLSAVEPWCELDTHQRRLERRNLDFSRGVNDEYQALEKLVARSRQHYRSAAESLSEQFLRALQKAKFKLPSLARQTETFARNVEPALKSGKKVAYVLVDSLRYEMARDLARAMGGDYEVEISAAVGTVPTITEIGMAALMPDAESGAKVVPVSEGKLGLEIAGTVLRDRKDRVKKLEEWAGKASKTPFETKLADLYSPTRATKANVKNADLVFVTSGEIDEQGESGNVVTARRFMDEVPAMLQRAVRVLADLGCDHIVLAADHGYVFADELDTDTKIDPPGGQTKDLHRRVWVGIGGSDEPYFLRMPLSRMDLSDDLEVAVPWGLGAFKAGGASAYFHGGMSPQEIAIPVMSLVPTKATAVAAPSADVEWEIKLGSKRISTRVISVRVGGRPTSLLAPSLPRVRVEVRISGKVFSEPMVAAYDYSETARDFGLRLEESGEIEENSVTLILEPDDSQARGGKASVHLLDAVTNIELARVEDVEMDISV